MYVSRPILACAAVLFLASACGGDDPISVSSPIGINMKAEEGDVKDNNVINLKKGITTESGNPWGAFISDVESQIGTEPGDIVLAKLELSLAANSEGVTELNQVFDGIIDIQFEMNTTNNFFNVGSATITADDAGRTISLTPSFDFSRYQADDLTKLLGGSFDVVLGAPAEAGFMALKAKAELQLPFEFEAFE